MYLMLPILGFYGAVARFSSFGLFIACVVLVVDYFIELQSGRADYCYRSFGELSIFVYCFLQKLKLSCCLSVTEKRENYMLPDHSCIAAIDEEQFLEGTRLLAALEKNQQSFPRNCTSQRWSPFFERVCQHDAFNCCSTFSGCAVPQLFSPRNPYWRWQIFAFPPLWAYTGWIPGFWLGQRQWNWSYKNEIWIVRARTAPGVEE